MPPPFLALVKLEDSQGHLDGDWEAGLATCGARPETPSRPPIWGLSNLFFPLCMCL